MALVAAGGLLGAAAREAMGQSITTGPGSFPVATLVINLTGAVLLGVLLEALSRSGSDAGTLRHARLLAGTGFLGAYTTYSTLAVEIDQLVRAGHDATAAVYATVSVLGGVGAAVAGIALGSAAWRGRGGRAT